MLCAGRGWWLSGILPRHLFQALVFGLGSVCLCDRCIRKVNFNADILLYAFQLCEMKQAGA